MAKKGPFVRAGSGSGTGGSAGEAGRVKAFLADRQGQSGLKVLSQTRSLPPAVVGGLFRLPPLPPTPRFKDNDDGDYFIIIIIIKR